MPHSKISPSAAHRWISCPGSVQLIGDTPSESSAASTRGTAVHALAYNMLQGHQYKVGDSFRFMDGDEGKVAVIESDMMEAVTVYVEHILSLTEFMVNPELWLEQTVKFHGESGTSDAILRDGTTLYVMDYKNGRVPVHVQDNPQLMIYAYGALKKFDKKGDILDVVLTIIQPNCPEVEKIQTARVPAADVRKWGDVDLKKAMKATKAKDAELVAGDWCRFCPAAGSCPALLSLTQEVAAADFSAVAAPVLPQPTALTTAQVANVLRWTPILDQFVAAVAARALDEMKRGVMYPGFKLVHKKTNREWPVKTAKELFVELKLAGSPDFGIPDLLDEPTLLSPAKLEKKFKWAKPVVAKVAIKDEGDLTVANEKDPREAVSVAPDFTEAVGEDLI